MKALLVRGDHAAMKLTERLFELFSDKDISWEAATAIGGVTAVNSVLTKPNYAVVKVSQPFRMDSSIC